MKKHGKRYTKDAASFDRSKSYPIAEAAQKLAGFAKAKFDQGVDICIHLGIDAKQADQSVRGAVSLPHGTGATKRVIAFCNDGVVNDAKAAGATEAGGEELVKKIEAGWMDFDVAIAGPDMMRVVSRLGKVLGPRGLMPSPKSGTVTADIVTAVREYGAGKVEFRNDTGGNVHAVIGKLSFTADKIAANAQFFIDTIQRMKPASAKGHFIKSVTLAGTMTPGVRVALS